MVMPISRPHSASSVALTPMFISLAAFGPQQCPADGTERLPAIAPQTVVRRDCRAVPAARADVVVRHSVRVPRLNPWHLPSNNKAPPLAGTAWQLSSTIQTETLPTEEPGLGFKSFPKRTLRGSTCSDIYCSLFDRSPPGVGGTSAQETTLGGALDALRFPCSAGTHPGIHASASRT